MNTLPQDRRTFFHPLSIATHWATLVLLATVYALIEFKGIFPKGSEAREAMKHWHFVLGLSIIGLVALRLLLRAVLPTPPIVPAPPRWQQRLAATMHHALYAFLIAMPLLGWLMLSAAGRPVVFFGWELPTLLSPDRELARSLMGAHETLATIGYALIGVHAAAALFHHHLMRDNTLLRMLPWVARRTGRGTERWTRRPAAKA